MTPVYIYIFLFSLSLGCQLRAVTLYVSCALDPALELRVARVSRLSGLRRAPSGARDGPTTHTETRPCQNVKPGTRNPKLNPKTRRALNLLNPEMSVDGHDHGRLYVETPDRVTRLTVEAAG